MPMPILWFLEDSCFDLFPRRSHLASIETLAVGCFPACPGSAVGRRRLFRPGSGPDTALDTGVFAWGMASAPAPDRIHAYIIIHPSIHPSTHPLPRREHAGRSARRLQQRPASRPPSSLLLYTHIEYAPNSKGLWCKNRWLYHNPPRRAYLVRLIFSALVWLALSFDETCPLKALLQSRGGLTPWIYVCMYVRLFVCLFDCWWVSC